MISQYDAECENVAVIAEAARDVCGTGGGAEGGFWMKFLSSTEVTQEY